MGTGLNSDYDQDWIFECNECELDDQCCDDSCEARVWVAPCGTIDYASGEFAAINQFCEPQGVTAMSFTDNATLREKQYRGCKKSRRRGQPDTSFSLSWDICQDDRAHGILMSRCPFDYFIAPKGNNVNFELFPSPFDLKTFALWGRAVGDTFTWEFPDDDCQNTTRTFMTDLYCWQTRIQALTSDPV